MKSRRHLGPWFGILVMLASGCAASTPEQKLLGKWICTPHVEEAVEQAVDAAAQGQKVNPLARGAAQFFGRKLAEATMSAEIDFHTGGTVFFRGNTSVLGLPADSDGSWEVATAGPDLFELHFGTENRQLQGKILFRDKDEFTLKLQGASTLPPQSQAQEPSGTPKQPSNYLVFRRYKD